MSVNVLIQLEEKQFTLLNRTLDQIEKVLKKNSPSEKVISKFLEHVKDDDLTAYIKIKEVDIKKNAKRAKAIKKQLRNLKREKGAVELDTTAMKELKEILHRGYLHHSQLAKEFKAYSDTFRESIEQMQIYAKEIGVYHMMEIKIEPVESVANDLDQLVKGYQTFRKQVLDIYIY